MNVAEGLELHEAVLSAAEQALLVQEVEHWVALVGLWGRYLRNEFCAVVDGAQMRAGLHGGPAQACVTCPCLAAAAV